MKTEIQKTEQQSSSDAIKYKISKIFSAADITSHTEKATILQPIVVEISSEKLTNLQIADKNPKSEAKLNNN